MSYIDFSYLDLHTEYSSILSNGKAFYNIGPCFAGVFRADIEGNFDAQTVFKIYTSQSASYDDEEDDECVKNNYMLLTEKQMESYLNQLNEIIPLKYKIVKNDELNEDGCFLLVVETEDLSHYKYKFLLSNIRHLWEFPQSAILKESVSLKKCGFFKNVNIFNVFNIVARFAHNYYRNDQMSILFGENIVHHLTKKPEMRKLLDRYSSDGDWTLEKFFPFSTINDKIMLLYGALESHFRLNIHEDIESSFTCDILKERYETYYKKLYNIVKRL